MNARPKVAASAESDSTSLRSLLLRSGRVSSSIDSAKGRRCSSAPPKNPPAVEHPAAASAAETNAPARCAGCAHRDVAAHGAHEAHHAKSTNRAQPDPPSDQRNQPSASRRTPAPRDRRCASSRAPLHRDASGPRAEEAKCREQQDRPTRSATPRVDPAHPSGAIPHDPCEHRGLKRAAPRPPRTVAPRSARVREQGVQRGTALGLAYGSPAASLAR